MILIFILFECEGFRILNIKNSIRFVISITLILRMEKVLKMSYASIALNYPMVIQIFVSITEIC